MCVRVGAVTRLDVKPFTGPDNTSFEFWGFNGMEGCIQKIVFCAPSLSQIHQILRSGSGSVMPRCLPYIIVWWVQYSHSLINVGVKDGILCD